MIQDIKKQTICRECGGTCKPSKGIMNYHNIQTQDSSKEFETKIEDCLKCEKCGHSFILEPKTNVQFYIATYEALELDEQSTKEVLAVFTDELGNSGNYSCYSAIGQHSICSKSFLRENCRKINKKEDYQELKTELELIGYNLNIL